MATDILVVAAVWLLASIPLALFVGAFFRGNRHPFDINEEEKP